jgi:HNH endonuclease
MPALDIMPVTDMPTDMTIAARRCGVTRFSYPLETAHLIPRSQEAWFNGITDYSISTVFPKINIPPNLLPLDFSVHKTFDQWQFIIFPKTFKTESAGSGSEAGTSVGARPPLPFVTHILHRNSAEFWPMRHNFVVFSSSGCRSLSFCPFRMGYPFRCQGFPSLSTRSSYHPPSSGDSQHIAIPENMVEWGRDHEEVRRWRITGSIAHEQETARRRDGCLRDE